jgi:hypothetical protein
LRLKLILRVGLRGEDFLQHVLYIDRPTLDLSQVSPSISPSILILILICFVVLFLVLILFLILVAVLVWVAV